MCHIVINAMALRARKSRPGALALGQIPQFYNFHKTSFAHSQTPIYIIKMIKSHVETFNGA
jgi:hypothetical protein